MARRILSLWIEWRRTSTFTSGTELYIPTYLGPGNVYIQYVEIAALKVHWMTWVMDGIASRTAGLPQGLFL